MIPYFRNFNVMSQRGISPQNGDILGGVPQVKLEHMINVEPSFVLYALLIDLGCCLRAHIILIKLVEPEEKKKKANTWLTLIFRP